MKNLQLPVEEICFFSSSSPAHTARLFTWKGDYYRAVRPVAAQMFEKMFNKGIIKKLIEEHFVPNTELTPLQLPGYSMVLKHQRLPFITYPFEWSAAALKDAALFILDFDIELSKYGLGLIDMHPWNIVFDGTKPMFVDFGSFAPQTTISKKGSAMDFYSHFTYPLNLIQLGQHRVARCLLRDFVRPISDTEYAFLTRCSAVSRFLRKIRFKTGTKLKVFEKLRADIEKIQFKANTSACASSHNEFQDKSEKWTEKQKNVVSLLAELKPKTLLDIGCDTGWYSIFAANQGCKVVAADINNACIERLYLTTRRRKLSIIPLFMDLRNPTAAYGWGGTRYPGAFKRLKSDCVLAMALIHHLVFHQMADFDLITDSLAKFSGKYLIVEFAGREDRLVKEWWTEKFSWYTFENFMTSLKKMFKVIKIVPSDSPSRSIIVCSKLQEHKN